MLKIKSELYFDYNNNAHVEFQVIQPTKEVIHSHKVLSAYDLQYSCVVEEVLKSHFKWLQAELIKKLKEGFKEPIDPPSANLVNDILDEIK